MIPKYYNLFDFHHKKIELQPEINRKVTKKGIMKMEEKIKSCLVSHKFSGEKQKKLIIYIYLLI